MPQSPGKIMEDLETLVSSPDPANFIASFLTAYGIPKATLNRPDRNIGLQEGDFGLRNKIYFRHAPVDEDLFAEAESLLADPVLDRYQVRFVLITDFKEVVALDRKMEDWLECEFSELWRHYSFFLPLAGHEKAVEYSDSPADAKAAERMGRLCDILREQNDVSGPEAAHQLHVFLTRLLFCLFAEDTDIFDKQLFSQTLAANTLKDGSDTAEFLRALFGVLNDRSRSWRYPAHLEAFPYVNGQLFADDLPVPEFTARGRRLILEAGDLDWTGINPDIFGSMFQSVLDPEQRGALGQHYTSYSNIMKILRPLLLDDLHAELEAAKQDRRGSAKRMDKLLARLSQIKVFDPACGSGNFLIVAYKELRRLEMDILAAKAEHQSQMDFSVEVTLTNFYGIEIDDFAHETAQLALWLAEHQMNKEFLKRFGKFEPTLPLKEGGNIALGNALRMDWDAVCPRGANDEVYVCGNPPFGGEEIRSEAQDEDFHHVFSGIKNTGRLDFVTCWFWKGAQYIAETSTELGLVATNSIVQGVQLPKLWPLILGAGVTIRFAYQSFQWGNSARDNAGVHVVVIGLTPNPRSMRRLFERVDGEWHESQPFNISPYLVEGGDTVVQPRNTPLLDDVHPIIRGSQPTDGGHLVLTPQEKDELIKSEQAAKPWIKRLLGSDEFLKGKERWCLWLVGADQETIDAMPKVRERVELVRESRLSSKAQTTRERLAKTPHLFAQRPHPEDSNYILVPRVTSERREYAPVGFFGSDTIANDRAQIIPDGTLYEFSIVQSKMHMAWLRLVGGRLENRFNYSGTLVYNTFPWPDVTMEQRKGIEALGQEILLAREDTPEWTMAEMYDPDHMPQTLREAHRALDEAVERLYRDQPFETQAERQAYLLARYEELTTQEKGAA